MRKSLFILSLFCQIVCCQTSKFFATTYPAPICAQAAAYFARMDVQPAAGLKALLNKEILAMVNDGIWDSLDVFVFLNLHTQQASLLDIKNHQNFALVGSPTWTTKVGVTTDGTGAKYINTQFNLSSSAVMYKLNNAMIVWYGDASVVSGFDGCIDASANGVSNGFLTYNTFRRMNSSAYGGLNVYLTTRANFLIRINATTIIERIGGVEYPFSVASSSLPNLQYYVGEMNYSSVFAHANTYACYGFGSAMSLGNRVKLDAIISDFMANIGTAF